MGVNQLYPSVDEHECSWADIEIDFSVPGIGINLSVVECVGVKWSRKLDIGQSRKVSGGRVMKQTAGNETDEASADFTRAGMEMLQTALAAAATALGQVRGNQVIIGGIPFNISIQHTPFGKIGIYEAKLTGCRYLGDSSDMKDSPDPDIIPVTLNPVGIATKIPNGQWVVLR